MVGRIPDRDAVEPARNGLAAALDGPYDVSDAWMRAGSRVAMLEASGRGPDPDQAHRLADALRRRGEGRLLGLATEDLAGTDDRFVLDSTAADLLSFAYERSGLNYAIVPEGAVDWLLLCTVDDYVLLAGPESLVGDFAPEAPTLAREFRESILGDEDWHLASRRRLLRHLAWAESRR